MRRVGALLVATCLAGAAFAQDALTPSHFQPQWEERPNARDFAQHLHGSLNSRRAGVVHLCCTPDEERRLDCRVAFEWPQNQGFGAAFLRTSRRFRLTPDSHAAYRADPSAWLQLAVEYRSSQPTREIADALARIREETRGLCAPAGVDPGPPQEPIVVTAN